MLPSLSLGHGASDVTEWGPHETKLNKIPIDIKPIANDTEHNEHDTIKSKSPYNGIKTKTRKVNIAVLLHKFLFLSAY